MSNKTPSDPGDAFRQLVTQWERSFNSLANGIMGTQGFSRAMNQWQDAQLAAQKAYRDYVTHQLHMANIPSRDDLVRVAESVQDLEKRMARIEDLLESMRPAANQANPPKGPPRTRKPPSARVDPPAACNPEEAAK